MDAQQFTLSNGLNLIYLNTPHTLIAHCGFVINLGTRDEPTDKPGLAHFFEHMLFKGTKKRRYHHISNRLEIVGGELNAYTTKEKICLYASISNQYFERAAELLGDLLFESRFPEKEMEKEKGVVLDEMGHYLDNYEERIYDEFEELVFPNHPLGSNILGTKESILGITQENLFAFKDLATTRENLVFCYAGPQSLPSFLKIMNKQLGNYSLKNSKVDRKKTKTFTDFNIKKTLSCGQHYALWGWEAPSNSDPNRLTYMLLSNLLGGDSLNSKLNMQIREKMGLVYQIEASYNPFDETGLFQIAYSCDKELATKVANAVPKVLSNLAQKGITPSQFKLARQQFIGKIIMAEEQKAAVVLAISKSFLDFGRIDSLSVIFEFLNQLTPNDLQQAAISVFSQKPALLFFDPQ